MDDTAANEALDNYLEHVEQRGKATASIGKRRRFLEELIDSLRDQRLDAAAYRNAVEQAVNDFAGDEGRLLFVATAREFYHFLSDGVGSGLVSGAGASAASGIHIPAPSSVEELAAEVKAQGWSDGNLVEMLERSLCAARNLRRYMDSLERRGVSEEERDYRRRVISELLYLIRNYPADARTYRGGVSALLKLYSREQDKQNFIAAAREFYYFWIQDPETASDPEPPDAQQERGVRQG